MTEPIYTRIETVEEAIRLYEAKMLRAGGEKVSFSSQEVLYDDPVYYSMSFETHSEFMAWFWAPTIKILGDMLERLEN